MGTFGVLFGTCSGYFWDLGKNYVTVFWEVLLKYFLILGGRQDYITLYLYLFFVLHVKGKVEAFWKAVFPWVATLPGLGEMLTAVTARWESPVSWQRVASGFGGLKLGVLKLVFPSER